MSPWRKKLRNTQLSVFPVRSDLILLFRHNFHMRFCIGVGGLFYPDSKCKYGIASGSGVWFIPTQRSYMELRRDLKWIEASSDILLTSHSHPEWVFLMTNSLKIHGFWNNWRLFSSIDVGEMPGQKEQPRKALVQDLPRLLYHTDSIVPVEVVLSLQLAKLKVLLTVFI